MMAWLPTYFTDTLSLTLSQAAQVSLLPPTAAIVASLLAGTSLSCAFYSLPVSYSRLEVYDNGLNRRCIHLSCAVTKGLASPSLKLCETAKSIMLSMERPECGSAFWQL